MTAARPWLALVLVLAATAASAQGTSSLRQHDTDAPIDVDAERIEVRDRDNQALFSGTVRVRQGDLRLNADTLRITYRKAGNSPVILRLDAKGAVELVSPSERARGDFGIYDVENRLLTLIGGVVLNQGQSVLRGGRLAIDLVSGRSQLDGGATRASPTPGAPAGGRVSGRFVVPERKGG